MDLVNWDDEELPGATKNDDIDDLFEFSSALQITDDNGTPAETLPPLPEGTEDVFGDRGVLIKRVKRKVNGASSSSSAPLPAPSEEMPWVELHYEGFLDETGEKFDSSRNEGYPMIARLDLPPTGKPSLIPGWEAALPELRTGDVATLTIAPRYAYGAEGKKPDIPGDATLRFEMEILDVRPTKKRNIKVDTTKTDLSRLEEIRRERETAQLRREEEEAAKKEEKTAKLDRAAALREKLANKQKSQGKKKGSKKKK